MDAVKTKVFGELEDEISKLVIGLYDETAGSQLPEMKNIAKECLEYMGFNV